MTGSLGGDTPAVARQRVRLWLRRARRDTTTLTQTDVAKRLGWSLSKVQRIEIGEVAISETDLRAVLELYGVTGDDVVTAMVKDARLARRERWTTNPEHRKLLSAGLRRLLQFEVAASEIRVYQPLLLPGILQSPATAEYIINEFLGHLTDDERKVHLDVRMRRRKDVLDRPDGPKYYAVLDESVILRNVGGPRITAEQLEDLADVATRPNIFVRVVPLDEGKGAIIGSLGSFVLMILSDDDAEDTVLYRERFITDGIEHDPELIRPYRDGFEDLWKLSLPEDATLRLIRLRAAALRVELDRLPATGE
ncbi:helix-turn-helix transcriptional regulator [Actinoplanes sp. NPDC026619]|uniref:helix-turn-helix domain-containing protein n=1 Tax=Actinoplanes sp. NPDC026619 TaxID=3155798 RepID=UPI0033D902EC